jgi:D-alanyl-D-alanine dipeptidase
MEGNFIISKTLASIKISALLTALFVLPACVSKETVVVYEQPVLADVEVREVSEAIIDLRQQNAICYQTSQEVKRFNPNYSKIRKTVYDMLIEAQTLLPANLRLCVNEGYRSHKSQDLLFKHRLNQIKAANPAFSYTEAFAETAKLISPVTNLDGTVNILPHATGGAIDVYLVNDKGKAVDMGLYPKDWRRSDIYKNQSRIDSEVISEEARYYRDQMAYALAAVGFVNYPNEYWHWSYGDSYWAYHTGNYAIYGSLDADSAILY